MPRIRNIKPEFFDDEELCQLKPLARLLFAGLWCWADREGRLKDQPARLKSLILPYDTCDTNKLLTALDEAKMIVRYEVEGRDYIAIRHFLRHQRPHPNEVPSTYPAPPLGTCNSYQGHEPIAPKARANPPEGNRREQKGAVGDSDSGRRRDYIAIENLTGLLNKTVADAIDEFRADHPAVSEEWIEAACEEAAANNVRSWRYVSAILKRWETDGFKADKRSPSGQRQPAEPENTRGVNTGAGLVVMTLEQEYAAERARKAAGE